jgi:hypothetical protein
MVVGGKSLRATSARRSPFVQLRQSPGRPAVEVDGTGNTLPPPECGLLPHLAPLVGREPRVESDRLPVDNRTV